MARSTDGHWRCSRQLAFKTGLGEPLKCLIIANLKGNYCLDLNCAFIKRELYSERLAGAGCFKTRAAKYKWRS